MSHRVDGCQGIAIIQSDGLQPHPAPLLQPELVDRHALANSLRRQPGQSQTPSTSAFKAYSTACQLDDPLCAATALHVSPKGFLVVPYRRQRSIRCA